MEIVIGHAWGDSRQPQGSHRVARCQMDMTRIMYICFPERAC